MRRLAILLLVGLPTGCFDTPGMLLVESDSVDQVSVADRTSTPEAGTPDPGVELRPDADIVVEEEIHVCFPDCHEKSCGESDGCMGLCFDLASCDDDIPCTLDVCDPGGELPCQHIPMHSLCEDEPPCATGRCDVQVGCTATPAEGPCDDDDLCTANDQCAEGECLGEPIDAQTHCDDNNVCTADSCHSDLGCEHENVEGECDYGADWLQGHCEEGVCLPDTLDLVPCTEAAQCSFLDNDDLCDGLFGCSEEGTC